MDLFSKDFGSTHKSSVEEMEFFRSFADSLLSNQPTSRHISSRSSSNENLANLNPEDMYFMQNCTSVSNFFDFGLSLPSLPQQQQQQQQQQHTLLSSEEGIDYCFEPTNSSTEEKPTVKSTRNSQMRKASKKDRSQSPNGDQGTDDHLKTSRGSNSRGKKESELEKMIRAECSKNIKYEDNQTDMQYNTSKDRRRLKYFNFLPSFLQLIIIKLIQGKK